MTATLNGNGHRQTRPTDGVEMRVHGIGDHEVFSALGRPEYRETADDRVWIGSLPKVPEHELKLINWSRASRQISRTISWYLAYPFTLLNVAGYMAPQQEHGKNVWLWRAMRSGIVLCGLLFTVAMAAWVTAIAETVWRSFDDQPDRLPFVFLCAFGPGLLIVLVIHRMIRGRALTDRGDWRVALLTIAVLAGIIYELARKPASGSAGPFPIGRDVTRDPMVEMILYTTIPVWFVATALCCVAWLSTHRRHRRDSAKPSPVVDRTAMAGAGLLLAVGITVLHTAGSMLRLAAQTVTEIVADRLSSSNSMKDWGTAVLLPCPDDVGDRNVGTVKWCSPDSYVAGIGNTGVTGGINPGDPLFEAQRIDFTPLFFLVFAVVLFALLYREYWKRKNRPVRTIRPARGSAGEHKHEAPVQERKQEAPVHTLVTEMHDYLGRVAASALVTTIALWVGLAALVEALGPSLGAPTLIVLQFFGIAVITLIIVRRPEALADRLRRTFGSLADIAGFWAPDLHPLAGASYRRAVLRGIREGVRNVREDHPGKPIALVGHSQGSVICAWFVRGGHWKERRSESCSDERAIQLGWTRVDREQSERIALFTCGSPLESLYRRFFPRYFDEDFFNRAVKMSYGNIWVNYWRLTDPIGTPLQITPPDGERSGNDIDIHKPHDGCTILNRDVTELLKEETKGHGEYWQDARLRNDVTDYFELHRELRPWHEDLNQVAGECRLVIREQRVRRLVEAPDSETWRLRLDEVTVSFRYGEESKGPGALRFTKGRWLLEPNAQSIRQIFQSFTAGGGGSADFALSDVSERRTFGEDGPIEVFPTTVIAKPHPDISTGTAQKSGGRSSLIWSVSRGSRPRPWGRQANGTAIPATNGSHREP